MTLGTVAPGFAAVQEAFERNFAERGEIGASFVATLDGTTVVDIWAGSSDPATGAPWTRESLCPIFSGSKGITATCMLRLIDIGRLELDRPVVFYWPEFGDHGKGGVLVSHALSHTAGVPGLMVPTGLSDWGDDRRMAQLVASAEPFWPPGAEVCYHPFTFGWICGELVRRIDGRSLGQFFRDEIAEPLGLAAWIGLPPEFDERVVTLAATSELTATPPPSNDVRVAAVSVVPAVFGDGMRGVNSSAWRRPEIPAGNAIADARSMARLYTCLELGGAVDGVRVVRPETVALGTAQLSDGQDPLAGDPLTFGAGFSLQNQAGEYGPALTAYGHCGAGGSVHGVWPDQGVAFSYVMNLLGTDLDRSNALLDALWASLPGGRRGLPT